MKLHTYMVIDGVPLAAILNESMQKDDSECHKSTDGTKRIVKSPERAGFSQANRGRSQVFQGPFDQAEMIQYKVDNPDDWPSPEV